MKMLAIIQDTFRESFAKKIFIGFFALSNLTILLFIFAVNLDIVDGAMAMVQIFGQEVDRGRAFDIERIIIGIESGLSVFVYTAGIFLSIFATASLIPNMLEKGNIDLLLSKPISRTRLLVSKYLGGLSIVVFNVLYLVVLMWLVMSSKTGFWNFGFLYSGIIIIVTFAVLYSLMIFVGLTSHSAGLTIMITYMVIFLSPILAQKDHILRVISSESLKAIVTSTYYILPKVHELGDITRLLVAGERIYSWMPLVYTLAFGVVMFLSSVYVFRKANF